MLRKIIKNKILSCLLFVAAVCHPAKTEAHYAVRVNPQDPNEAQSVEQSAKDSARAEKEQAETEAMLEEEEAYLGRYDLKTGERIYSDMPDTIQVGNTEFYMATPGNLAQVKPVQMPEATSEMVSHVNAEGIDFLVPHDPMLASDEAKPATQKDLADLLNDLDKVAASNPPATAAKEGATVSAPTASAPEKDLAEILALDQSTPKARSTQKDLEELLSDPTMQPEQPKAAPVQVAAVKPAEPAVISEKTEKVTIPEPVKIDSMKSAGSVAQSKPVVETPVVVAVSKAEKELEELLSDDLMTKPEQPKATPVQVAAVKSAEPAVISEKTEKAAIPEPVKPASIESAVSVAQSKPVVSTPVIATVSQTGKELEELLSETEKPTVTSKTTVEMPAAVAATSKTSKEQIGELLNDPALAAVQTEEQKKANMAMAKDLERNIAGFLGSFMLLGLLGYFVSSIGDKDYDIEKVTRIQEMTANDGKANKQETSVEETKTAKAEQPAEKQETPIIERVAFKHEAPRDERKILSEHIWGLKAVDEIKRRRAVLTREMAKAKREGDEAKMAAIQAERKDLSAKRKAACLRVTGPEMAQIKEARRLLTKRMTIARRQQDQKTMDQITAERLVLKEQVQSMNSYIRAIDYQRYRKDFMQELRARQREYARAA